MSKHQNEFAKELLVQFKKQSNVCMYAYKSQLVIHNMTAIEVAKLECTGMRFVISTKSFTSTNVIFDLTAES